MLAVAGLVGLVLEGGCDKLGKLHKGWVGLVFIYDNRCHLNK